MENTNSSKYPSDLTGVTFNHFTVVKEAEPKILKSGKKMRMWECLCTCGNTRILNRSWLISGNNKSCGCMRSSYIIARHTTHGGTHTRLHRIWIGMRSRCCSEKDKHYKYYGARGIYVCDEWIQNYESFRDWSLSNSYNDTLTLDRIDNNGPYAPWNCRWVDRVVQANNTRANHCLVIDGEKHTVEEWSRISGTNAGTIRGRLKRGWSEKDSVFKEVDTKHANHRGKKDRMSK